MMRYEEEIVTVLTILLFGIPVFYFVLRRKAFSPFSLNNLTRSFNRAFIVQLLTGAVFFLSAWCLDKTVYENSSGNALTDIVMQTGMTYGIIGLFCYCPGLAILNLVNFINNKLKRR